MSAKSKIISNLRSKQIDQKTYEKAVKGINRIYAEGKGYPLANSIAEMVDWEETKEGIAFWGKIAEAEVRKSWPSS